MRARNLLSGRRVVCGNFAKYAAIIAEGWTVHAFPEAGGFVTYVCAHDIGERRRTRWGACAAGVRYVERRAK